MNLNPLTTTKNQPTLLPSKFVPQNLDIILKALRPLSGPVDSDKKRRPRCATIHQALTFTTEHKNQHRRHAQKTIHFPVLYSVIMFGLELLISLFVFELIPSIIFPHSFPILPVDVTHICGHLASGPPPAPLRYSPSFLPLGYPRYFFPRRLASNCAIFPIIVEKARDIMYNIIVQASLCKTRVSYTPSRCSSEEHPHPIPSSPGFLVRLIR